MQNFAIPKFLRVGSRPSCVTINSRFPQKQRRCFCDIKLLNVEIVDQVAVVTMLAPDGQLPWGTRIWEHRINPLFMRQVNSAIDDAEKAGSQALVVTGDGRFFSNGMDLQYISANVEQSTEIQRDAEKLLARILGLGMPTVAAINGHFTAAGAMFGLSFDVRIMPFDGKGLFFVPGIDIGLVYSEGMTELMKAKMPQRLWNDVICFGRRYKAPELHEHGVVNVAPFTTDLMTTAVEIAMELRSKGKDEKQRETLKGIKANLYKEALASLGYKVDDMGFARGTFSETGRAAKH